MRSTYCIGVGSAVAILLIAGWLVTPERLIELGPMRRCLTSEMESVRRLAQLATFHCA